jgi:Cu-processing system ATP-binding protein
MKAFETDNELLEKFRLKEIFHKRMNTLSGGTRQKVSATLAFLFNPKVLILDEPTAGLDPLALEILKEKIRSERDKGKLILVTSHILSDLDEIISEVVYLQDGNVLFHKNIDDLMKDTGERRLSKAIARIMSIEAGIAELLGPGAYVKVSPGEEKENQSDYAEDN